MKPKIPVQTRSRDRVRRITEFTETLLQTMTLDQINITMISEGTGINRSSIHQFFPNIFSIFKSIALEHMEGLQKYLRSQVATAAQANWETISDLLVEASADYYNAHPATMKIMLGSDGDLHMRIIDKDYDVHMADLARELFGAGFPPPDPAGGDPIKLVIVIVTAIFALAVYQDGYISPFFRQQAIVVTRGYLSAQRAK